MACATVARTAFVALALVASEEAAGRVPTAYWYQASVAKEYSCTWEGDGPNGYFSVTQTCWNLIAEPAGRRRRSMTFVVSANPEFAPPHLTLGAAVCVVWPKSHGRPNRYTDVSRDLVIPCTH